jgi:uncharacterized spore protein YtfJ
VRTDHYDNQGVETVKLDELLGEARDTMTVKRVFGEPYEKNGVTFIPAAAIRGGGGGGEGEEDGARAGSGAGFGVIARPVGAYTIKGDSVEWVPAADATRVILMGQTIAIVGLLVLRSILRRRKRRS